MHVQFKLVCLYINRGRNMYVETYIGVFYDEYIGVFYGYLIFIFINLSIPSIDKEAKFLSSKSSSFVLSRVYPSIPPLSQA